MTFRRPFSARAQAALRGRPRIEGDVSRCGTGTTLCPVCPVRPVRPVRQGAPPVRRTSVLPRLDGPGPTFNLRGATRAPTAAHSLPSMMQFVPPRASAS
jgi:hypothetical protein